MSLHTAFKLSNVFVLKLQYYIISDSVIPPVQFCRADDVLQTINLVWNLKNGFFSSSFKYTFLVSIRTRRRQKEQKNVIVAPVSMVCFPFLCRTVFVIMASTETITIDVNGCKSIINKRVWCHSDDYKTYENKGVEKLTRGANHRNKSVL